MTGDPLPAASAVSVSVVNASGATNQATATSSALAALGFNMVGLGDAPATGDVAETVVYYGSRSPTVEAAAQKVARSMTGSVILAFDPSQVTNGAEVTVVTGTQFAVNPPASASVATTTTIPASSAIATRPRHPATSSPGTLVRAHLAPHRPRRYRTRRSAHGAVLGRSGGAGSTINQGLGYAGLLGRHERGLPDASAGVVGSTPVRRLGHRSGSWQRPRGGRASHIVPVSS